MNGQTAQAMNSRAQRPRARPIDLKNSAILSPIIFSQRA
jgi:hypothetical protein